MNETQVGIYLIVAFDWPRPFSKEHAQKARKLHDIVQDKTWIREIVAASGGIGEGPSSLWIFWLPDYAALDILFHDTEDPVHEAYHAFFSEMPVVKDRIREEVAFL